MVRRRLTFSGMVQGVGFRYRSYYIAESLGLTGWVKNQWDGTVLMEVQGSEDAIDRLIINLGKQRFIYIEDIDIRDIPVDEHEKSFNIR
ncbi:MAG: acylphosphatase [Lachnospiraceae bacterium]|nr:acylphosphatase [Lachnospiraceae bacterium]